MYCEFKNEQYWVWSSRLASLDCIPQYKVTADSANDALLSVCASQQLSEQKKANIDRVERRRAAQKEYRLGYKLAKEEHTKTEEKLYLWATKLI